MAKTNEGFAMDIEKSITLKDLSGHSLNDCDFNVFVVDNNVTISLVNNGGEAIGCDITKDDFIRFADYINSVRKQI